MTAPRIYCCEALGAEVRAAVRCGMPEAEGCTTFAGCCGRPPVSWNELRDLSGGAPAIVVGGECLAHLGATPDDLSQLSLVKKRHCAALVCGDYAFDRLTAAGGYLVTPGWLEQWRDFVEGWGFDQSTAAEFFTESCARITLLETGSFSDSGRTLQEFARFVDRPTETVPVGLDLLGLQLKQALHDWERRQQEGRPVAAAPVPASDYALLLDFLSKVPSSSGERPVVEELLAFFAMLFGAAEVVFLPAGKGGVLLRHGETVTDDRVLRQLAEELDGTFQVVAEGGFLVRLSHDGVVGWLWAAGFTLPHHLQSYLNLAVTGANVCAMAIASARAVYRDLKEREEKYRLLFENMSNGFALLEMLLGPMGAPMDFRFVEVNPAFEEFSGKSSSELVGRTLLELLPDFDPGQMESLTVLAREGTPLALERYVFDGKCCQVWLFRPKPGYCGMIINDITRQKLLEDKLRHAMKMESVGRLAGGVAHDFNNMLSVIIGYAELLGLEYHGNKRIAEGLYEICKAAQRSRDITAQLLTFSRQQLIHPQPLDVNAAIGGLSGEVSRLAGEGARVYLRLCREGWNVKMDPVQLREIICNIVRNAGAAMPDGGELAISTANVTLGEEECSGNLDAVPGEYLEVSIADSGQGMDQETCRHIFEPFFTTREVGQGVGLGLATVYGMVTQNGGFINVFTECGAGTTFRIYLPRVKESVLEAGAPEITPGSGTVLVIEDDEVVARVTAKMLEHMGYRVLMAESSEQAVELCRAKAERIDLVLSDVMLPGASGKEGVAQILALRPSLRIIYMSGYAPDTVLQKGVDRSQVNFIQKPFDMTSLNLTIQAALSGVTAAG